MKAAIYCRLSREDQFKNTESESIQNQRSMLLEYAAQNNWEVFDIYCDEDYSGIDRDRPEFMRLISDARRKRFDIVLVKTQSRFTRDMELVEKYIHGAFQEWGIRFVAAVDHADTEIKGNKKARQINGLINEWYLEDLSENIRAVLDYKRKIGQHIGSFALYGYCKDPSDKNQLRIDPQAADVVRAIFGMYLAGYGTKRIARTLNSAGIPNPAEYKRMHYKTYRNGGCGESAVLWNRTTVSRILKNRMYIGDLVQGKRQKISYKSEKIRDVPQEKWIVVPNTHEAIICPQVFETAQRMIKARTRETDTGTTHPLAGMVHCAACGSTMQKSTSGAKGAAYSYLRCKLHEQNPGRCTNHSIRLNVLEDIIAQKIRSFLQEAADDIIKLFCENDAASTATAKWNRQIAHKLLLCEQSLSKLYDDRIRGILQEDDFQELYRSYRKQKESLQLHVEASKTEGYTEPARDNKAKAIESILHLTHLNHEICALFIRKIQVGEHRKSEPQKITIYWNV